MKTTLSVALFALALAGCTGQPLQSTATATTGRSGAPPKVILLIGDGMDDHQITIARDYLVGASGRLILDGMPHRSAVQTLTVAEEDPLVPEYVPDSANTATSMATGIVTSAGRIGTTAQTDRDAVSIIELAAEAGFGTGIVTTANVTDATPASFVAHVNMRLCEGPRNMYLDNSANPAFSSDCRADQKLQGGKGSISEQIAASRVDVVLGGGMVHFDQPAEGDTRTVRELAAANGYRVIGTAAELASLERRTRVLGLFSHGTMPVQWRGEGDAVATLVPPRPDGGLRAPPAFACEPNPEFAGMPRLREMSAAALKQLDDGRSFALMIESASIDKQSHLRRPCGQIGELAQLEETLELLLEYQRAHPETLVLVTADHGQAAQLVPETSWLGGAASPGHFARLRTREGVLIGVNYATNDSGVQEDHSGVTIPLFASGPGALELPAFLQQRDIFGLMVEHLGLQAPPLAE